MFSAILGLMELTSQIDVTKLYATLVLFLCMRPLIFSKCCLIKKKFQISSKSFEISDFIIFSHHLLLKITEHDNDDTITQFYKRFSKAN